MYRSARITPIMAQIYRLFTAITPPPVSLVSPKYYPFLPAYVRK
jgi:hypothetical protein